MDKKQTAIAVIRGVVPIVCVGLTMAGISADADIIVTAIGGILSLVTFVWSWWKNNNITKAAQEAQQFLDDLKKKEAADGESN